MNNRSAPITMAVTLALIAHVSQAQVVATTQPAELPVKEVVLFSSGVGYFEHFGTVQGNGNAELHFKTDQINDILKSLILQDLDGGSVAAVTYPSQDPIGKTLKSFQVDITANPPLAELLNQLRGAKVTISVNGEKTVGVILGVEKKQKTADDKGGVIEQAVLNLVAAGKIISQPMEGVSSIELDDPALQEELNKALTALAGARDQDKKPVKISFNGTGERHIRLGYVVETPIWKTSYRLILGSAKQKPGDKPSTQPILSDAHLQGWAIVENQTDNDWNNVQLSLVSGRPISFIEDLYQPLYVPRPVVEPELFASLRPPTYAGGLDATTAAPTALGVSNANKALAGQMMGRKSSLQMEQSSQALYSNNSPMDAVSSVASLASAANVGELFEFTVGSVTLPRQRSAMIPIITDPIEVERVSIYNQSVMPRNPLNGAKIKNITKKHLLAGPITVLDAGTYAGDAQIDNLPPGQDRLLSYGVDLEMLVDAANNVETSTIQSGKIVKGVLLLIQKTTQTQDYVAENKSDHDKILIVEHPRRAGWELADSGEPMEKTDSLYRFRESVPAGKSAKLSVKQQIVEESSVAILQSDSAVLDTYKQQGQIAKPVLDALAKAAQMKTSMVDTQRQIDVDKLRLNDITEEQNRIRDNLKSVSTASQYYTRLMTKLNDQETEIEKTQKSADDLQKQFDSHRTDLESYLANLNLG